MTAATKPAREEITTRDLPALIADSPSARQTIAPFLPAGVSLDRVAASLRIALAKDRGAWKKDGPSPLERCSPMSVFMAVARITSWGLEIGETAHLVPFGAECTPIADYKGLIELIIWSGMARMVEAHCVYAKEPFVLKRGTHTELQHDMIGSPADRGPMVGAYAMFHLGRGLVLIEYMSVSEIEEIRQAKSMQWKSGALAPWYAKKCVIRRGAKLLPKNPRLLKTLAALDAETVEVPTALAALEAGPVEVVEQSAPAAVAEDASWDLDDAEPAHLESMPAQAAAPVPTPPGLATEAPCPVCSGAMWNQATTKTNVRAPDFVCQTSQCEGKYWPGQWPPKPDATSQQVSRLQQLIGHAAIPTRTRTSVEGLLVKGMKVHRAAEAIEKLEKLIAAAVPVIAPADDDDLPF